MTHDNQTPAPPAGRIVSASTVSASTVSANTEQPAEDVSLSVLTMAYPAFRFSFLSAGFHRAKWPGLRKKPADPGPQAVGDADASDPAEAAPD